MGPASQISFLLTKCLASFSVLQALVPQGYLLPSVRNECLHLCSPTQNLLCLPFCTPMPTTPGVVPEDPRGGSMAKGSGAHEQWTPCLGCYISSQGSEGGTKISFCAELERHSSWTLGQGSPGLKSQPAETLGKSLNLPEAQVWPLQNGDSIRLYGSEKVD